MTPDGFPVVGIVGAGQLARMMVQESVPLGIALRLLAERADDSAARIGADVVLGSPDSVDDLVRFAQGCDVVTLDHELVNIEGLEAIAATGVAVHPRPDTLLYAKDKLHQRARFAQAGLPVPAFAGLPSPARGADSVAAAIVAFAVVHGWPVVAKAQRGGYDGRGVWVLADERAATVLARESVEHGTDLLVEQCVPIEREIAVLVARRPNGEAVVYPVVETVQRDGICHEVIAPAPIAGTLIDEACDLGLRIAALVQATGIVATELFVAGDRLWINEIATRPHNSGHFSLNGCATSQFENHLRAVLDWPLGAPDLLAPHVVMTNLLGVDAEPLAPRLPAALALGVYPHLYGKASRPGRKIGHVNALGDDLEEVRARAVRAAALIVGGG